jgi:hypothetical protein
MINAMIDRGFDRGDRIFLDSKKRIAPNENTDINISVLPNRR